MSNEEHKELMKKLFDRETAVIIDRQIKSKLSPEDRMEQAVEQFGKRFNELRPKIGPEEVVALLSHYLDLWGKVLDEFDKGWGDVRQDSISVQE